MGESIDALKRKYILLNRGISEGKIEEVFDGYSDSRLAVYGYQKAIDTIVDALSKTNYRNNQAEIFINKSIESWRKLEKKCIFEFDFTLEASDRYRELEEFYRLDGLGRIEKLLGKIEANTVLQALDGFGDPNLGQFGYNKVVNNAIGYIIKNGLDKKKATDYLEKKISEWGAQDFKNEMLLYYKG